MALILIAGSHETSEVYLLVDANRQKPKNKKNDRQKPKEKERKQNEQ